VTGVLALVSLLSIVWLGALASCSGSAKHPPGTGAGEGGVPGGSGSGGGAFIEASHTSPPPLVFGGAPLLTAPEIVTVTFAGDPNAAALEAFDDDIVTSSWWSSVTAGFCDQSGTCIGKGSSGGHVRLAMAAAASYSDSTVGGASTVQALIAGQIQQGILPPATPNSLYVLYVPGSSLITLTEVNGQVVTTCAQFSGYHNAITIGLPSPIPYAVVQECAPAAGSTLTPFEAITLTASHEILEGVSDPIQTGTTSGYALDPTNPAALPWALFTGGEAGDLCEDPMGLGQERTTADSYTVQRMWSNASATDGLDPCVPVPAGEAYFNVSPKGTSAFMVLRVGGTATFEADAFSSAATGPWTLSGIDWATRLHLLKAPLLSFFFNGQATATVNNGDKVEVTVTLDADPAQLGSAEGVLLSTTGPADAPTAAHTWPILVVTPAEFDGGT
jgi:hypothetical protein